MKKLSFLLFVFVMLFVAPVSGAQLDLSEFGTIPVVYEGRVKPLNIVAWQSYLRISGESAVSQKTALPWLADVLFGPANASDWPFITIKNHDVITALHLPKTGDGLYSFNELNGAFIKQSTLVLALREENAADLTPSQSDLLDLYSRVTLFEQLKNTLTLVLPLKVSKTGATYLDLSARKASLTREEKRAVTLLGSQGQNNQILSLIPLVANGKTNWFAPWDVYLYKYRTANADQSLKLWQDAASAYIHGNADAWQSIIHDLYRNNLSLAKDPMLKLKIYTELVYNKCNPFLLAAFVYGIAFFLGIYRRSLFGYKRYALAMSGSLLGLLVHGTGILERMIILQRPPVSTLYESVLFVSFIVVGLFLLLGRRRKEWLYPILASLSGAFLLMFAFSLADDDDSLKILQAVLNSNFWLGTHVIIITLGYALCVITTVLAHLYLAALSFSGKKFRLEKSLFNTIYVLSLWSLLFVTTGTILGGIWADQSWGRFWGWDPKENGALLIILWLVWLLHNKVSHQTSVFGFIGGLVSLGPVIALSWIGVNLLGVGLHSYGFINGLALGLGLYLGLEILFLVFCFLRLRHHARATTIL